MSEYTPETGRIRDAWRHDRDRYTGVPRPRVHNAEFDRWLTAHDAGVRADQIEKDAAIAEKTADESPYHFQDHSGEIVAAIRAQLTTEGNNDE